MVTFLEIDVIIVIIITAIADDWIDIMASLLVVDDDEMLASFAIDNYVDVLALDADM